MPEVGSRKRSCHNITRFFQLQSHLTGRTILEDAPQHYAVTSMDVALGYLCDDLLALERRCSQFWNLLDAVAHWFTSGHERRQHSENRAGGGVGLGSGYTALKSGITEQAILGGRRQLRPLLVRDAHCKSAGLASPGNDFNDIG